MSRPAVENSEAVSELSGKPLQNRSSAYLHLEQGLAHSYNDPAIISIQQPEGHLDGVISICSSDADSRSRRSASKAGTQVNGTTAVDIPTFNSSKAQDRCLKLSFNQTQQIAETLAAGLLANGASAGSVFLMMLPNIAEFGILLWTSIILRITYVCVDPEALRASDPGGLRGLVQSLKPSIIAVSDSQTARNVDQIVGQCRLAQPLRISLQKESCNDDWMSLSLLAIDGSRSRIHRETLLEEARNDDPQRVHSILFTSGTSGTPKGCPLRVGGQTHVLHSQSWLLDKDACQLALQQAHPSRGIASLQLLQTWRAGGAVVMTSRGFAAEDAVEAIRLHHVTFLVLTPSMVHEIEKHLFKGEVDVNCVRTIQLGGDAVTRSVFMRCTTLFPRADICVNHGMSEGGGAFQWPFRDKPASEIPFYHEICPIGTVAPGSSVRILDVKSMRLCPRGIPGELHVRSGALIKRYMFGVCDDVFYEDQRGRWFKTGDMAVMESDGIVYIINRVKDAIWNNGMAVMPAILENCIEAYTGQEAVVVDITRNDHGNVPVVVLSQLERSSAGAIQQHVAKLLGEEYRPDRVITLGQLGLTSFPANATHKIMKSKVRTEVLRYLNSLVNERYTG